MEEIRNSPFSNNELDRISNLPECLIHHILSFLDMKYVVQTSFLSRRWRYMWISVSTLVFASDVYVDEDGYEDEDEDGDEDKDKNVSRISFERFVDKVLMLRGISCIIKFDLYCDRSAELSEKHLIDTWILAVARRNLQELNITIEDDDDLTICLPHCLVTSGFLTGLELDFEGTLILPDSMGLPDRLKIKSLSLASFATNDLKFVNKLISSCPVLENLAIKQLRVSAHKEIRLPQFLATSELLTGLELDFDGTLVFPDSMALPRLKTLTLGSFEISDVRYVNELLLSSPALETLVMKQLHVKAGAERLMSVNNLELKHLEISYIYYYKGYESEPGMILCTPSLTSFTSSPDFLEILSEAPNLIDCQLLQFCNLRRLELEMYVNGCCLRGLTCLLTISPSVESLLITLKETNSADASEAILSGSCIMSYLKFIEIREVKGYKNELIFFEFVLKNAKVLEKMVLHFCKVGRLNFLNKRANYLKWKERRNFSEKIKKLPRVSSRSIIRIHDHD